MSKKIMLLALAVAAMFAIPSAASAQEIHFNPSSNFTITGSGGTLTAQNEPAIKCTKTEGSGTPTAGSTTTGTISLIFTGCTAEFFGIKGNCNTTGSASGTIKSSGTYHLITITKEKPGTLTTTTPTTIICAGFSSVEVTGDVIGTITSPACNSAATKKITVNYVSTGTNPPVQEHSKYTEKEYVLKAKTDPSGEERPAGLTGEATLESEKAGVLECT
jgi:hypothetical protein